MIEILHGGTQTTVQDNGRHGLRHLGIPSSGAADKLSFALANWMAGNSWDTPAIECALGGLHIRFLSATTIGLAGAEMWAQINGCLLYTSPSPRDQRGSRMPSSA